MLWPPEQQHAFLPVVVCLLGIEFFPQKGLPTAPLTVFDKQSILRAMPGFSGASRARVSSQKGPRALTMVETALKAFERQTKLIPRVALLPPDVFERYVQESRLLADVLPLDLMKEPPGPEWTEVRVIEHLRVKEIEVY